MKHRKRFRTLVIIGFTLTGMVVVPIWLSFAITRQHQLDADLLTALTWGQVQEVNSLLKEGADPNTRDLSGVKPGSLFQQIIAFITRKQSAEYARVPTALCYAANQGIRGHDLTVNPELVKLLLDYGANVKIAENCDPSPLLCAASWGETSIVRLLLDHGANANRPAHAPYDSALHAAIMNSDPEMLQLLLEHGAQIQVQRDITGRNDLDWAQDAKLRTTAYSVQSAQVLAIIKNASKTR